MIGGELINQLILIRHGETAANQEGRFQGRLDQPLNQTGRDQVTLLANKLATRPITHVYSSPAKRAKQTADILNAEWEVPLTVEERLWEIDQNKWDGRTWAEVQASDPVAIERWLRGEIDAPHGGESLEEAAERVTSWFEEIKSSHSGGELFAITAHAGILQVLLCRMLNTPVRTVWPFRFQNAGYAELHVYERGTVLVELG